MARQLTTRTVAERELLATFRHLTPQGQKALQAWADFLRHLFAAP